MFWNSRCTKFAFPEGSCIALLFVPLLLLFPLTGFTRETTQSTEEIVATQEQTIENNLAHLKSGQLSSNQITDVATKALRHQLDEALLWDHHLGEFVELAYAQGKLPIEIWKAYLLQAVQIRVRVSAEAARSEGLPIWIDYEPARGSSDLETHSRVRFEHYLSGKALHSTTNNGFKMKVSANNGSGSGWTENLSTARHASLKPGQQTYHYRFYIQVYDPTVAAVDLDRSSPVGERIVERSIPWRLLAKDEPKSLPEPIPDPAVRGAIEKSLRAQYILRDETDKTLAQVMVQVDEPPTDMAFDLSVRTGQRIWAVGPVAWSAGNIGWWAYDIDLPSDLETVDLVFTASVRAAAHLKAEEPHRLIALNRIWDGDPIVLTNVQVRAQRIEMIKIKPRGTGDSYKYAWEQLDATDPAVEKFRRLGDPAAARLHYDRIVQQTPNDARALYNLGCLNMAETNRAPDAMKLFARVRDLEPESSALSDRAQRQLRRLCSIALQQAEDNDVSAMLLLGKAYEGGVGVGFDVQQAKRWYRNASNRGHAESMLHLAHMYEHKIGARINTDEAQEWYHREARDWYRKAADLGNEKAKQWMSENTN